MNAPIDVSPAVRPVGESSAPPPAPDLAAIKTKQQAMWSSGDYAVIGTMLQIVGEELAEAADLRADERVLDVAAGNGNASLAAGRRFAKVTAIDYVPQLLDKAAERARADGFDIAFRVADAEALPFADASFDVVLSTFGAMFAPDHVRTAGEMVRVVRPGGRIGFAAWTPEGFIGELFRIVAKHVPPPAGVRPAVKWGDEPYVVELFGPHARDLRCTRRLFNFRYRSPAHWIDVFRTYYGPTLKAFAALDAAGQSRLYDDLVQLLESRNVAGRDSLVVPSEYLEAVIVRN